MASLFHNTSSSILILSTLIFLLRFVPSSYAAVKGFREIICTRTSNPSTCLTLDPVRNAQNTRELSKGAIDLALIRANEVHSQLNQNYFTESYDGTQKDTYFICSKNYNDAIRDLTVAQGAFDITSQFRLIPFELNDAQEELKSCSNIFSSSASTLEDATNIRQANEDLFLLIQIAEISSQIIAQTQNY